MYLLIISPYVIVLAWMWFILFRCSLSIDLRIYTTQHINLIIEIDCTLLSMSHACNKCSCLVHAVVQYMYMY
jgi:hypothetical protein